MSRVPYWMDTSMGQSMTNNLSILETSRILHMSTSWEILFMAWRKHQGHDMIDLEIFSVKEDLKNIKLIILFYKENQNLYIIGSSLSWRHHILINKQRPMWILFINDERRIRDVHDR